VSNDWSDTEAAAAALVSMAQQQGIDLARYCSHSQFCSGHRYIHLWMKGAQVGYAMQGKVGVLPEEFRNSASAFYGMWHEAGVLPDIERAFEFVRAWLLDGAEVDHLPVPERERRRYGIG
jgi:hypothetical protein